MEEFTRKLREYAARDRMRGKTSEYTPSDTYNDGAKQKFDDEWKNYQGSQLGRLDKLSELKHSATQDTQNQWQDYKNSAIDAQSEDGFNREELAKQGKMIDDEGNVVDIDYNYYSGLDDEALERVFGPDGAKAVRDDADEHFRTSAKNLRDAPGRILDAIGGMRKNVDVYIDDAVNERNIVDNTKQRVNSEVSGFLENLYESMPRQVKQALKMDFDSSDSSDSNGKDEPESGDGNNVQSNSDDDGEWIEYTYKPGDTFGQVLIDQGLATNHGLWGADGDVAYYNQYLDPSKMASYGIPVGTTIRLKKRK